MHRLAMYFSLRAADSELKSQDALMDGNVLSPRRRGLSRRRSNVLYALVGVIPAVALTYGLKGLELPREHMMAVDGKSVASLEGIRNSVVLQSAMADSRAAIVNSVVCVGVKRDGTTITVGTGKLTLQSSLDWGITHTVKSVTVYAGDGYMSLAADRMSG